MTGLPSWNLRKEPESDRLLVSTRELVRDRDPLLAPERPSVSRLEGVLRLRVPLERILPEVPARERAAGARVLGDEFKRELPPKRRQTEEFPLLVIRLFDLVAVRERVGVEVRDPAVGVVPRRPVDALGKPRLEVVPVPDRTDLWELRAAPPAVRERPNVRQLGDSESLRLERLPPERTVPLLVLEVPPPWPSTRTLERPEFA